MNFAIDGIVPIIPTPFSPDEEVAWHELESLIDFAVNCRACAVCLPAYASEFYKLSETERLDLVSAAVESSQGRIPVIAQVNSASLKLAKEWVQKAVARGASAICTAVPRMFALPEKDLLDYMEELLGSTGAPFVIQDFNPGGPTLSANGIAQLQRRRPNFRYVKLEEAMLAGKVAAIQEATNGTIGVLEGWGGMYTLELADAGISGVVPGLGLTDLLREVLHSARNGEVQAAERVFEGILPQIVYSLQNLELFHHAEKRLLRARGVLRSVTVRRAALTLTKQDEEQIDRLNERILRLVAESRFPGHSIAGDNSR